MNLTPAQMRVYEFLQHYMQQNGYAPSYDEIRRRLGFRSLNAVYKHLKQLEERGMIRSPLKNRKRALELLRVRTGAVSIPFLGIVAAGTPIEPMEEPESIEVPESLLGSGSNFALRVQGESMIEEGIREGDLLIVSRQARAENGQTVVALVRGEATVKKLYQHDNEIELRPANSRMEPIRAPAAEVEIVGVVVGLLRHYRPRRLRND
ncbi:MAG: transcriptional repressor LexA [Deltaproteobacteria bacterium]|nr:transcriptional repressor LexA [Deltaproteobacteria bacterium]